MAFAYLNPAAAPWINRGLKYVLAPPLPAPRKTPPVKSQSSPLIAPNPAPPRATPATSPRRLAPPNTWPLPWQERLKKTAKGKIAWSYWDLGEDLGGVSSDEAAKTARRQFIAKLIKDLGFPKGSHAFWPAVLPEYSPEANPALFWAGLNALGCRGAALFGSKIARILVPGRDLKPLTQLRINGCFVWILRDISALITNVNHYEPTLHFLRGSLARFVGL